MRVLMEKHKLDAQGAQINKRLLSPSEVHSNRSLSTMEGGGDIMLTLIKTQSNLLFSRPA